MSTDSTQKKRADAPKDAGPQESARLTPCISKCRLNADGYCVGCARAKSEIAAWGSMPAQSKREIMQELPKRFNDKVAGNQ